MKRLHVAWAGLVMSGTVLVFLDILSQVLIKINGVPAVGVLGGALILLASSSMLNWLFKMAWDERMKSNGRSEVD